MCLDSLWDFVRELMEWRPAEADPSATVDETIKTFTAPPPPGKTK
ncbi:unnamed protein product, partial [Amoebophrya sp. A120]|eukprot:GSA120T00023074001.1